MSPAAEPANLRPAIASITLCYRNGALSARMESTRHLRLILGRRFLMPQAATSFTRTAQGLACLLVLLLSACATTLEERAERGDTEARVEIAKQRLETIVPEGQKREAREWIQTGAEEGNPEAQYLLGVAYYQGDGVPQDYTKSFEWIHRSAEEGNVAAQGYLGGLYRSGLGTPPDIDEALRWYRTAAEGGDPMSQYFTGVAHDFGARADLDPKQAAAWYAKASNAGVHQAQYNLALLYLSGRGVKRDEVEAFMWLHLAQRSGSPHANKTLEELNAILSEKQVFDGFRRIHARLESQGFKTESGPVEKTPADPATAGD
jgi:TPR repeat protein